MLTYYRRIKNISNNIVKAIDINNHEVFICGNGIGYKKKNNNNEIIPSTQVERVFSLVNPDEKSMYEELIQNVSPNLIDIADKAISIIESDYNKPLNDHIHIALTDHIAFLARRCKLGETIENPFSNEIEALYPKEADIARKVVNMLNSSLNIVIPEGEVGFITLHILTSTSDETMYSLQKETLLIKKVVKLVEDETGKKIDKKDLAYSRFVTHVRFLLERLKHDEQLDAPIEMFNMVKNSYHSSYQVAKKVISLIEQEKNKQISDAEVLYMTLHIYKWISK
jgi:transcriptional antiterminator